MARRRRSKQSNGYLIFLILGGAIVLSWWWLYAGSRPEESLGGSLALAPQPALTSDRPDIVPAAEIPQHVTEKGANDAPGPVDSGQVPHELNAERAESLIDAGKQALARSDALGARSLFSEALPLITSKEQGTFLRAELTRLANDTIFSQRILPNDPLVGSYVIKVGDNLAKIASQNKVSDDLLASLNGIRNKNLIRAGQNLKVIHGPFSAVVHKKQFRLDLYLGTVFVKSYPVGLGLDGSTPAGEWRVRTKLVNPTYYPPRGGGIIAADDPKNPLGERWIELEGISGEALGQQRYGMHGTIDPESIGKEASLGCVRLYNEDVEELYTCLVEKYSIVTIQ